MSLNLTSPDAEITRSVEMLFGSDTLTSEPATTTSQLADLGTIVGATDDGSADPETAAAAQPEAGAVEGAANGTVLETHANLESTGHDAPVTNAPIHDVITLGETIGLGYLGTEKNGETNLLTDGAALPGQLADGGGVSSALPVLSDASEVVGAASMLGSGATGVVTPGGGLIGAGGLATPFLDAVNDTVTSAESIGHGVPVLEGPAQAVWSVGDAVGLGDLGGTSPNGGSNLLTDLVNAPTQVVAGDGAGAASGLVDDLGHVVDTTPGVLGSVSSIAGQNGGLLGSGGLLAPVTGLANATVTGADGELGSVGQAVPIVNGPVSGITALGEATGLGHLGGEGSANGSNVLTDLVNAPGAVLGGQGGGLLGQVISDVAPVANAADGLIGGVTHVGNLGADVGSLGSGALGLGNLGSEIGSLGGGLGSPASGGSQPLVSVAAGEPSASPLGEVGLLGPANTGQSHAADVGAGTAPAGQPPAIAASLADGHGISVPSLGGAGSDALVGALAATAPATASSVHDAAPTAAIAPVAAITIPGLEGHGLDPHDAGQGHGAAGHALL